MLISYSVVCQEKPHVMAYRSLLLELKTLFPPMAAILEYYPEINTSHRVKIHHTLHALSHRWYFFCYWSLLLFISSFLQRWSCN